MHRKNRKTLHRTLLRVERGVQHLFGNRKGVSVVISTVVLSAGVLALGIAVLYWAYSWGSIANLQYSKSVANSSYAVSERLGFEYISYSSTGNVLTVNVINWGNANNLTIIRVFVWDSYHTDMAAGSPSQFTYITNGSLIQNNYLNMGEEGRFTVVVQSPLQDGHYYNIRVVTGRGRNFDGSFVVP